METRTIRGRFATDPPAGRGTFVRCFEALFGELRDCAFVVDQWRPDDLPPARRELLARYRVAGVDVGRRVIDVYRGRRFLDTFGPAIPSNYGSVFALAAPPDEATLRACMWDDAYQIHAGRLAPAS